MNSLVYSSNNLLNQFVYIIMPIGIIVITVMFLSIPVLGDMKRRISMDKLRAIGIKNLFKSVVQAIQRPMLRFYNDLGKISKFFINICKYIIILTFFLVFLSKHWARVNSMWDIILAAAFALITTFLVYISFYIVLSLLITSFNSSIMVLIEYIWGINKYIGNYAICSLIITIIYLLFFIFNFHYIKSVMIPMAIGLFISFIYVIKGLYLCISKPDNLYSSDIIFQKYGKYIGMFTWLIILLLNLYCQVILSTKFDPDAFHNSAGKPMTNYFDLLYFTIVTFATVGFGDITPYNAVGKFMTIVVILSSMLYITIFIGSVLSANIENAAAIPKENTTNPAPVAPPEKNKHKNKK